MTGGGTGRRVVVTGLGVVSAIGSTVPSFLESLREGRTGIADLEGIEDLDRISVRRGAQALDFDAAEHFGGRERMLLDRFARFAVVAAREAVAASDLGVEDGLGPRSCVVLGSGIGGLPTQEAAYRRLFQEGKNRSHPLTVPRIMPNAGASAVSSELGVTGPTFTTSTACASSTHAIGLGFWMVRGGLADVAVVGGSEAPLTFGDLNAWEAMRVLDPETCRPFSRNRKGTVLGEGAGVLILEPLDAAVERGAPLLAEVVGFGMSSDADHLTTPSLDGPSSAMRSALLDGAIRPSEVDYVNAHGTGTVVNDRTETTAIRQVFDERADLLAVSSTKSLHGHALGAGGALEAVATVLALQHQFVPPTANYAEPDPDCDLDVTPNVSVTRALRVALSNSFAFGGLNAVLAFRRWTE